MSLPLVTIKGIIAIQVATEIGCIREIGCVTSEAVPRFSDITVISVEVLLLAKETRMRLADVITVLIMVHQISDHAAI